VKVYFGNNPALCQLTGAGCSLGTLTVKGTNIASANSLSVTCGHGPQIWIAATTGTTPVGRTDFQLQATVTQRTLVSISANSVNTVNAPTVYSISNTGVITSATVSTAARYITATTGDSPVNTNCNNLAGCPNAFGSCAWLSQPTTYYFLVDPIPTTVASQCSSTVVNGTFTLSSVTPIPITASTLTTQTLTAGSTGIYVRTLSAVEQAVSSKYRVRVASLKYGDDSLSVYVGCNGAVAPSDKASCSYYADSFSTTSQYTDSSWLSLTSASCGVCSNIYITVKASSSCSLNIEENIAFQLYVDLLANPSDLPANGTALSSAWQVSAAQSIRLWAYQNAAQNNYWSITSTTDGFIHVGIGNVNNTVSPADPGSATGHTLKLSVYLNGCIVQTCTTGQVGSATPVRLNNYDQSCFVNVAAPSAGLTYIAGVQVLNADPINRGSGAFYRAQGYNSFIDISTSGASSTTYQIQGRARHYFKTPAVNTNGFASVVIHLNIIDGPRLLLQVADSPNFITAQNAGQSYSGWVQSKICPFGTCTIEVPTYAAHPQVTELYVWVTPAATNSADYHDVLEKPTDYTIFSTIGTQNCGASTAAVPSGGFCAANLNSTNAVGFWLYRNNTLKDQEASCLYNQLLGRCPAPTFQCSGALAQFACLQGFLECDSQGFQVTHCQGLCLSVVNVCGPWYSKYASCSQEFSDYDCLNTRYLPAEPCTGNVAVVSSSGGFNFGLPGSINTPAPAGGFSGGGFNQPVPLPTPSNVPITPDQVEPPIQNSTSHDCGPSPSASPVFTTTATTFIPSSTPSVSAIPPRPTSSAAQLSFSGALLLIMCLLLLVF